MLAKACLFCLLAFSFVSASTQSPLHLREPQTTTIASASTTISPLILSSAATPRTTSPSLIIGAGSPTTAMPTFSTSFMTGGSNIKPSQTYCGWAACPPPSSTTTPHPPIPTKIDPKCNVAGYPSEIFKDRFLFGGVSVLDVPSCQSTCFALPQCWSYAYQVPFTPNTSNCILYTGIFDARNLFVIPDQASPLRFSDKYPQDGSNFCFGNKSL